MRRLFAAVDRGVEILVAAIFAAMCAVGLLQVFNRFVLNQSLSWSEEFQIFCHVWIVFLAIPIAYRRGAHLAVESLRARLPRRAGAAFDLTIELLWAAFAGALAWRLSAYSTTDLGGVLPTLYAFLAFGMVSPLVLMFTANLRNAPAVPAPEPAHAIRATIDEAIKAREEGKKRVLLFNLCGHGLLDLSAYDSFLSGTLRDT